MGQSVKHVLGVLECSYMLFFRDGVTLTVGLRGVGLQSYSHKQQGGGQSLASIRCHPEDSRNPDAMVNLVGCVG